MQTQSKAAAELEQYFDSPANYAHVSNIADLVLERLPSGEFVWLKPSTDAAESDDALWWPTESGRDLVARWRAERACLGREVS
jgi:hypothetical protein